MGNYGKIWEHTEDSTASQASKSLFLVWGSVVYTAFCQFGTNDGVNCDTKKPGDVTTCQSLTASLSPNKHRAFQAGEFVMHPHGEIQICITTPQVMIIWGFPEIGVPTSWMVYVS